MQQPPSICWLSPGLQERANKCLVVATSVVLPKYWTASITGCCTCLYIVDQYVFYEIRILLTFAFVFMLLQLLIAVNICCLLSKFNNGRITETFWKNSWCPYCRYLIEEMASSDVRITNISQSLAHKMAECS